MGDLVYFRSLNYEGRNNALLVRNSPEICFQTAKISKKQKRMEGFHFVGFFVVVFFVLKRIFAITFNQEISYGIDIVETD